MAQDINADVELVSRIEAVPTILDVIRRTTGMGWATVARVTEDRWIACSVLDEIHLGLKPGDELSVETTICHEIRQSQQAVVINNVSESELWCHHPGPATYGFQSYISVPIILAGRSFFGTLCALDPRPARLDNPETIGMFRLFAELIAKHLDAWRKLGETEAALAMQSAVAQEREQALRASEQQYRELVNTQNEMICRCRPDAALTFVNDAYCRYFGKAREELIGANFFDLLPEYEHRRVRTLMAATLDGRHSGPSEHCLPLPGGSLRWSQWVNHVIQDGRGDIEIQSTGWDITETKRAQEALRKSEEKLRSSHAQIRQLAGHLITAQERERRHLARELHDDLNQQLAAIAISLSNIRHELPASSALAHQLEQIQKRANQIADSIRTLSHQLHPAVLEHGGLVVALRSLIDEFSNLSSLSVHLELPECLEPIPKEPAICIFRIVQEALRNVYKHAQATAGTVKLSQHNGSLHLVIADNGVGFDPESAPTSGGLGLISMAERVHLLRGAFEVRTNPGDGTAVHVSVPIEAEPSNPSSTTPSCGSIPKAE